MGKKNVIRITFWHCYYCGADNVSESSDIYQGNIIECASCGEQFSTQDNKS